MSVGQGVVSLVQRHSNYGLCVLVMHQRTNKTYYSFYAHLSEVKVQPGQKVNRGTVLGKSGTSGNARCQSRDDEHLHFEYRVRPKHGPNNQDNPNKIVKTKFYSAEPNNRYQSQVGVVKKISSSVFE